MLEGIDYTSSLVARVVSLVRVSQIPVPWVSRPLVSFLVNG